MILVSSLTETLRATGASHIVARHDQLAEIFISERTNIGGNASLKIVRL